MKDIWTWNYRSEQIILLFRLEILPVTGPCLKCLICMLSRTQPPCNLLHCPPPDAPDSWQRKGGQAADRLSGVEGRAAWPSLSQVLASILIKYGLYQIGRLLLKTRSEKPFSVMGPGLINYFVAAPTKAEPQTASQASALQRPYPFLEAPGLLVNEDLWKQNHRNCRISYRLTLK